MLHTKKCPIHEIVEWCHDEAGWKRGDGGFSPRRLKDDAKPCGRIRRERSFVPLYCQCQTEPIVKAKRAKTKTPTKSKRKTS
jgi:hypothetical protein